MKYLLAAMALVTLAVPAEARFGRAVAFNAGFRAGFHTNNVGAFRFGYNRSAFIGGYGGIGYGGAALVAPIYAAPLVQPIIYAAPLVQPIVAPLVQPVYAPVILRGY